MSDPTTSQPTNTLPEKIVVTLRAGGVFFAAANVICVSILAWVYLSVKLEPKAWAVTGSARKAIVSDLVTWSGTVSAKDPILVKAYDTLKIGSDKVKDYLIANGIPDSEITLSAITTVRRYQQQIIPGAAVSPGSPPTAPTVITTDKVEMFTLTQSISISRAYFEKITLSVVLHSPGEAGDHTYELRMKDFVDLEKVR